MKMKIKRIKAKAVKWCNLCGKKFELWDKEENFCFHRRVGYGSAYDGYLLNLNLCCNCFDRLMDELVPKCEINPLSDPYAELASAYTEDLQGR